MHLNQEKLMKRRMIRALVLFGITFIALLVFIALYIDACRRVQETYRREFHTSLTKVNEDIDSYLDSDGDHELRYRRIISDMSSADSFAFLIDNIPEEHKRAVNEIHTCIMKFPEQMKGRLPELKAALEEIIAEHDKGYDEVLAIVASVDKKGH